MDGRLGEVFGAADRAGGRRSGRTVVGQELVGIGAGHLGIGMDQRARQPGNCMQERMLSGHCHLVVPAPQCRPR